MQTLIPQSATATAAPSGKVGRVLGFGLTPLTLLLFAAIGMLACATSFVAKAQNGNTYSGPNALKQIRADIATKTKVPVRLPTIRPMYVGSSEFLIENDVTAEQYEVIYAAVPDCAGAHVCSYGAFRGSLKNAAPDGASDDRKSRPVHLYRGTLAHYLPFTCAAYCDEAELWWNEGLYTYSISIKAGTLRELTDLANSALRYRGQ